jgi:alkylation response protein AidB-like acyl-CoA dehydrogenase
MSWLDVARRLADELLFPAASQVDLTGELPPGHLDALAAAGLYGVQASGGRDDPEFLHVIEVLAAGCLATAFVWIQHHGAVRAAAAGSPALREQWLAPLSAGLCRAAVAQAGVRPGPAAVRARRVAGGYRIDGEAEWVTGWGLVDVIHTAARLDDDRVVWALIDADPGLPARPLALVAVNASRTVSLRFEDVFVADDRVTSVMPLADWPARDAAALRPNGSLALGSASRSLRLLEPLAADLAGVLHSELDACRERLDVATPQALPAARAAASELALRAASTLSVAAGARGILAGQAAQRLLREAAFLLVFGSRPAIRTHLLESVARA